MQFPATPVADFLPELEGDRSRTLSAVGLAEPTPSFARNSSVSFCQSEAALDVITGVAAVDGCCRWAMNDAAAAFRESLAEAGAAATDDGGCDEVVMRS